MKISRFLRAFCLVALFAVFAFESEAKKKDESPGAAARECAKQADPKSKDDCVRAANENRTKGKSGERKEKSKAKKKKK